MPPSPPVDRQQALSAGAGVRTSLAELIDMRHRVREVPLFSTPHRRSPLVGLHHSKLRGRGVDFDQVRIYQAGDDVRTIDWRVTARTQEPHTKLFHEERERPIYILVEQSPRLFFGSGLAFKSVLAAQAASLVGWAALSHNDRVGGLVFGQAAAKDITGEAPEPAVDLPDWDESRVTNADEEVVISHNWDELRRFMWSYVGIVRTTKRLERARRRIELLREEINEYYATFHVTSDLLELRNLVDTADLIVLSAMLRHESRGLHYSRDYPELLPQARDTILKRQG